MLWGFRGFRLRLKGFGVLLEDLFGVQELWRIFVGLGFWGSGFVYRVQESRRMCFGLRVLGLGGWGL